MMALQKSCLLFLVLYSRVGANISACDGVPLKELALVPTLNEDAYGLVLCRGQTAVAAAATPVIIATASVRSCPSWVRAGYAAVQAPSRSSLSAWAVVTAGGALLNVSDIFDTSAEGSYDGFALNRSVTVLQPAPSGIGFVTAISLALLPSRGTLDGYSALMPGVWIGDGGINTSSGTAYTPPWAIGGTRPATGGRFIAREDRLAAPIAGLWDSTGSGLSLIFARPGGRPDTILADVKTGGILIDSRLNFGALGLLVNESSSGAVELTWAYPGSEWATTYVKLDGGPTPGGPVRTDCGGRRCALPVTGNGSVAPADHATSLPAAGACTEGLWRLHPASVAGAVSTTSLLLLVPPPASTYAAFMDGVWREADALYAPVERADINLTAAFAAVVGALSSMYDARTFPLPGVPTGANKTSGRVYSTVLELGFVGPAMRQAVSLLYLGLASDNPVGAVMAAQGSAIMDAWTAVAGPGWCHTVWDTRDGTWIDDGTPGTSYTRRLVEGHLHAIEAADVVTAAAASGPVANARISRMLGNGWQARIEAWKGWGLSLGPILLGLQAEDGSWARAYARNASAPFGATPVDYSKTATALPMRFLVAAAKATGNGSYIAAAEAAGLFAWYTFGSRSLYVGAAIDNPDVMDKESALFASDGYLALWEETGDASWLAAARAAALVAHSWHRLTSIPVPVDAPPSSTDWASGDTSAGFGIIALGHSGSDVFASMFSASFLALCIAGADGSGAEPDAMHGRLARRLLTNTAQPLDLDGSKRFFAAGAQSELFDFSANWNVFTAENDGRGTGDPNWVPWTNANEGYGFVKTCSASLPVDGPCSTAGLTLTCPYRARA